MLSGEAGPTILSSQNMILHLNTVNGHSIKLGNLTRKEKKKNGEGGRIIYVQINMIRMYIYLYIPLARLYVYIYIYRHIYTYSTVKFVDKIFIKDALFEKDLNMLKNLKPKTGSRSAPTQALAGI